MVDLFLFIIILINRFRRVIKNIIVLKFEYLLKNRR